MSTGVNLTIVLGTTLSASAFGQSLNVDFGHQAGVPAADFAGAGLPGVWNAIEGFIDPPGQPLLRLDGAATGVQLATYLGTAAYPKPETTGDVEALLDDLAPGTGDASCGGPREVRLSGLAPGDYDVITYAWDPHFNALIRIVTDAGFTSGQGVTGAWPGTLAQGVTHTRHRVAVGDGTLEICVNSSSFAESGVINGFQLIRIGCGNGAIEDDEACDDGNTISGDGCSALCVVESSVPAISFPALAMLWGGLLAGVAAVTRRGLRRQTQVRG